MAEAEKDEKDGEAAAPPAPKGGSKKLLIIIAAVVVLILAAGVPVAIMTMGKSGEPSSELSADAAEHGDSDTVPEGQDDEDELDEDEEPLGAFFPMETFTVNLSGGTNYLRCQMQLEFFGREVPARFYPRMVLTRDAILSLLTSKAPAELATSEGKEELKDEVKEKINEILKKEDVKRVYFTQFVIQ